ncbi:MAG: acyltransferase domain-containing protein, partial [Myxococcota bacterium]|nr:acyltransferase domain-containing protein [Myxococcota bacterium]
MAREAAEDDAADADRLRATMWAQPALGLTSLSMLRLLEGLGLRPAMVGGHSFGEITALHAAGVLDEDTMLKVARKRGELMAAEAAKSADGDPAKAGAMTAVSHPRAQVEEILASSGTDVVIANANSPEQLVLSGTAGDLDQIEVTLRDAGARVKRLQVATAFHSSIVAGATEPFQAWLEDVTFGEASLAVYSNSEAAPYPSDAAAMRALLAGQIARPVRFAEEIEAMYAAGARTFVEIGPGAVLSGLVGACLAGREHTAVPVDRKGAHGVTQLWRALGALAVAGVSLDLESLWADTTPVIDPATVKAPMLVIPIDGSNHEKPYPPPGGAAALPGPNPPRPVPEPVIVKVPTPVAAAPVNPSPSPVAAPTAPAPTPVAGVASSPSPAWLEVYERMQTQTADIHAQHMEQMAQVHEAYLNAAETTTREMVSVLHGGVGAPASSPAPTFVAAPMIAPPLTVEAPTLPAVAAAPVAAPEVAQPAAPAPVAAPPAPSVVVAPAAPVVPGVDMGALLLDVVADKTGYPAEILRPEMSLEADLGIDSIKRVEILSAVREAVPGLPDVDASEMAALQTIGEVLGHLEAALPGVTTSSPAQASTVAPVAAGVDMR